MSEKQDRFMQAVEDWMSNDGWEFADKEAAWRFMFQQGVNAASTVASREISDLIREFDRRGLEGVPEILAAHRNLMT